MPGKTPGCAVGAVTTSGAWGMIPVEPEYSAPWCHLLTNSKWMTDS